MPSLTSRLTLVSARLNIGSFCCVAIRSRLRTIGTPASTRAASLLANTAFSLTPGAFSNMRLRSIDLKPAVSALSALPSWVFPGLTGRSSSARMPRRRSSFLASARLAALIFTVRGCPVGPVYEAMKGGINAYLSVQISPINRCNSLGLLALPIASARDTSPLSTRLAKAFSRVCMPCSPPVWIWE